jgi:hypothetical protein
MNRTINAASRLAAACLATLSAGAHATNDPEPGWRLGLYTGQGVEQDLRRIPADALQGDLHYTDSYETGVFVARDLGAPDWLAALGTATRSPVRSQVVFTAYAASGLATNEALAIDWRPSIAPSVGAGLSLELGFGIGVWHAFGTPWYDHRGHASWDSQYHTLLHLVPELMVRHEAVRAWAFGVRIDHASGAYGAFAPSALGTNHVGLVVTRDF